ncbi:MAG: DUF309 domain-containing protein [Haloferacaceae archaeon]
MDAALRAGIAVYNAGHRHAAHDAWEDRWLALPDGSPDERFLHGLIQFTAAVHHAEGHNWPGAAGLAASAVGYLDGLGAVHRGVDLAPVRAYLRRLAADPETVERAPPPPLVRGGRALALDDLAAEPAFRAATALAASDDRFDATTVAAAADYAREELDERGGGRFVALTMDFARGAGGGRPAVYARLRDHVERRRQRDRDVDGLFE